MTTNGVGPLLLATRNLGKVGEFKRLLAGVPFDLVGLEAAGVHDDVEETGSSFEENASIKARAYASLSGMLALAEDSGLEVDALGGGPGIRSARYGGPGATDEDRVELLLEAIRDVPRESRTARFRSVIALGWPSGEVKTVSGAVEGLIALEPSGHSGFGYDPVFYLPERGRTMAELPMDEKDSISHRGEASRKALVLLQDMIEKERNTIPLTTAQSAIQPRRA